MTDIQHVGQGDPQNRLFKQIGTGPDGQPVLAEYVALEPGSIGSGGGGTASSVTIADGTTSTQKAAVDASGRVKVDGSSVTQPISGSISVTNFPVTQPVSLATNTPDVVDRAARLLGHVTVDNFPATQPVSLATNTPDVTDRAARLLGHVTVDNASIPVTGTFWQATQPVSLATNTPDVTDRVGRLLGHVTVDNASIPVTGTFFQATQPVSLAAAVDVSDRAARLLGVVDKGKVWDGTNIAAVKAASALAVAADPAFVVQHTPQRADASVLAVTTTAATGVAATLTIPAAAAGLFHYITYLEISLYATAARTGGATPILVTTTNLPGSPVWDFDTAQAIGAMIRQQLAFSTPLKSSVAATATTIVAPIATTGIWRITAFYYTAP